MIRILVAEDMRILRETLVALFDLEDDLVVVAELGTGDAVLAAALAHHPHVAVLDIDLPGRDGLTVAAELCDRLPACRVLVLTGVGRPGNLQQALRAGAAGFMLKDAPRHELLTAIRTVAAGGRVIDPGLAIATLAVPNSPLTEREAQVLQRFATGADPQEIATALGLSYGTVRNYLASAVTKLGARNRVDAVRISTEAGWL